MDTGASPPEDAVLEAALDQINHGVVIYDRNLTVVRINRRAREILHVTEEMFAPGDPFEKLVFLNANRGGYGGGGTSKERVARRMAKARTFESFLEDQTIFDGSKVEVFGSPGPGGIYVITYTDITRRVTAEAALVEARDELERRVEARTRELRESEEQLRLLMDAVPARIMYLDRDLYYVTMNEIGAKWLARPLAGIAGMKVVDVIGEANFEKVRPHLEIALAGRNVEFATTVDYPDGVRRDIETTYVPHKNDAGDVQGVFVLTMDVTARRELDEKLRNSQKLEAVGQLTGGVAHDFNNLLGVIMGNIELLKDRAGTDAEMLSAIIRATERGAELTKKLLAFSRRQPLRPQAVNLGSLASGMSGLLSRTLGETIEMRTVVPDGLWPATVDPGQVENAILNLAINARDAMPGGGKLTIECANVRLEDADSAQDPDVVDGDYVMLAVSDNGTGMREVVRAQAFEPFFTTKEVGEGSGLGLSMVYGFVKQSGGHATICSELGCGTTVKLYLPRAAMDEEKQIDQQREAPRGTSETILVVEDDPDIRGLTVRMLEALGYRACPVVDAAAAEQALAEDGPVDLVLSDVALPGGTSGPEFATRARTRYPGLKFLFMSGYPAEASQRNGLIDPDETLLNKPFRRQELAEAIRAALSVRTS